MKISLLLLVSILLSGGAVFQAEASLDTRLIDAAEAGEAAEVRKLLSSGASVTESVAALLQRGADIELGNSEGWTALFEAASKGHVETVRLLLRQGALPTAVDRSGSSPADYARSHGYQQIVELLESAKAPLQ